MKNKVSKEHIDDLLKSGRQIINVAEEKCVILTYIHPNGFMITESSGCVDKSNFSLEIGIECCLNRITDKLWAFEGYLLAEKLHQAKEVK